MAKKKNLTYADLAEETEKRDGIDDIIGVGEKYKQSTPTVPISSKRSTNRNALGSFISSFLPTSGLVDKAMTDLKNDEEFTKKATEKGLDINSLKTPQDILNEVSQNAMGAIFGGGMNDAIVNKIKSDPTIMSQAKAQGLNLSDLKTTKEHLDLFGADLDRSIEALGVGTKGTLSNAGKGALLIARDMGGAVDFADKIINEARNLDTKELEEYAKKANISTETLKDYINKSKTSYENINDFSANTFDKWANEANQRNLELQEETDNPFTKAVIGFMPNVSQQAVNLGVSFINPALVPYVAGAQAKGSYFNDAKERGMTDEQANNYSSIMAGVEALTEKLTVKDMKAGIDKIGSVVKGGTKGLSKEAVKEVTKQGTKEAFKSLFKGMAENAGQEAVTEIIQESVADAITGKELGQSLYDFANQKDNWEDIWSRVLKAGASGALTAGITGGVGMGVKSCVSVNTKLQNGEQVSQEEMVQANKDALEKSKTLPEEQQKEFNNQINKGAENAIISEKTKIEAENEQNIEQPTETAENAQIGEDTEEQQITQEENENALKENVEPQNQEQTQENQAQEENVQENLTEEEKLQKTQEKLTEKYGEETAQKLLNNFSPEEINNITNINEELNNKNQNDIMTEEEQVEKYFKNKEEIENDFRSLQEESRGLSERESELYRRGSKKIDEALRTRLQGVLSRKIQSVTSNVSNDSRVLTDSKTGNQFKVYDNIDGQTFHDVFEIARTYTENGELVDLHPVETNEDATGYNDTKNYLSADGMSGYAITKDGDLISVFNANPEKRGWIRAIAPDVKKNAKTLDCYISPKQDLSKMYSKAFGFKIASEMDYNMDYDHDNIAQNHEEPQVAFMVNTDQDVQTQMFTKDDYEGAQNYQQSFIKGETGEVSEEPGRPVEQREMPKDRQVDNKKRKVKQEDVLHQDTIKELKDSGTPLTKEEIAKIVDKPQNKRTEKQSLLMSLYTNFIDRYGVFENIAKKTKNKALDAKANMMTKSLAKASRAIENGGKLLSGERVSGLETTMDNWNKIAEKYNVNPRTIDTYAYNLDNIDRMTLAERGYGDNAPIFGESMTAEKSRQIVSEIENKIPEIKDIVQDLRKFDQLLEDQLVMNNVISQDTANYWNEKFPHHFPVERVQDTKSAVAVPLDSRKTGVNAPIQKAVGGNGDIQPIFEAMKNRALQVYKASDRNSFGLELRNTLQQLGQLNEAVEGSTVETLMDGLQEQNDSNGVIETSGQNPTLTVFDNGQKVTFEISPDMAVALKPRDPNSLMSKFDNSKFSKVLRKISNLRRGVLTEYNLGFMFTNPTKDLQDVLLNSQHAKSTYMKIPEAFSQIKNKGFYYQEYMDNGGGQNSIINEGKFENFDENFQRKKVPTWKKVVSFPFRKIGQINEAIEMMPRLAEYMASREQGQSIQESMLDASRVTTNFGAGGELTKFANRNGVTFLNASVQGLAQNVRNIREANQKGVKGYAVLLGKAVLAGIPALTLNGLIWDDDEDYEELSDYIKDNYYIIGKVGDTFIRIPKGRAVSVIQDMMENAQDYITGDKEINADQFAKDFFHTIDLAGSNLAPNNPLENNVLSPVKNVLENKTWYGSDLVPKNLQKEKPQDQINEKTDEFSKWLGQTMGWSPIKINYLLDQYGGIISDIVLPPLTPKAEDNFMADKFTADATMENGNPGKFYEMRDSLDKSNTASEEDKVKVKYVEKINSELNDLYKQQREIQMSPNTYEYKKEAVKNIRSKINELSKNALKEVENFDKKSVPMQTDTTSSTSSTGSVPMSEVKTIGDYTYYKDSDGKWKSVSKTDMQKNENAGISNETYARYKEETQGLTTTEDKITALQEGNYTKAEKSAIYENYISKSDKTYKALKEAGVNIDTYLDYKLNYNGTSKDEFYEYINSAKMSYPQKLLLTATKYKLQYEDEKDYLVDYINKLKISSDEKKKIFRQLKGATITSDGQLSY